MAELIVLGSGTGVPSLRRGSPGLALISEGARVLIDSGSGTLRKLLEAKINYLDLDLLLYTHTHPDHIADLVPILFASKYSDFPRQKDLLCIGGPGFNSYFDQIKKIYSSWIEPQSYRLTVKEISDDLFFRDLKISSKPMAHLPSSRGYRIEFRDGKSLGVSLDTDYCENLVSLALDVDLLAIESSFPDGRKVEGHLTPSLAGRVGLESRCKRLLLTHLYPVCDDYDIVKQCRQFYPGEAILAEDLMRIEIE